MIQQMCKRSLEAAIPGLRCVSPEGSVLSRCSGEILTMIRAYYQDGMTFLAQGDDPNALASFSYALGWLDAGASLGLIEPGPCGLPMDGPGCCHTGADDSGLRKKTSKYQYLLRIACNDLLPAAEEGSCLNDAGERFLTIARIFHDHGNVSEHAGDLSLALASYSYGFAWLDAGVRTGLFRIREYREIFTI